MGESYVRILALALCVEAEVVSGLVVSAKDAIFFSKPVDTSFEADSGDVLGGGKNALK